MNLLTQSSDKKSGLTVPASFSWRRVFGVLMCLLTAVVLTKLAFISLLIPAAIFYVVGFSLVAWYYPGVALMLIFASAPFQNDLSSGGSAKFSIAEINLLLTLPVLYLRCLLQKLRLHVGPILVPVLLYFAVCLFSSSVHWLGATALLSLVQMFLYFVVAVTIFCVFVTDPKQYWVAFHVLIGVGVFLAIAGMATGYWFIGLNKNGLASSLACCFLVAVELILSAETTRRRYWLLAALGVIGMGLLFSLSRGAWLGTLSGVFLIFALRGRLGLLLKIIICLLPLIAVFWFTLPASSRNYATGFGQDHYNIKMRYASIDIAQSYFNQSPVYGMGVGLRKNYDATNLLLMTLAETGVLGALALLLIHAAFFQMIWRTQKQIARSEVLFSLLCIGGALVLDKFVHGMVDQYWSRGAVMVAWAGAGMATRAYYAAGTRGSTAAVTRWQALLMNDSG
ncbi:MAG: hypothetical protein ACRYFS_14620 [Janthinobacterium lividum]